MGFVDDTRQYNNKFHTSTDITQPLEKEARLWQKLLSLTGGSMRADKCASYILQWTQAQNGTMEMTNTTSNDIRIIDEDSCNPHQTKEIKQLKADQPFTYVGITTAPNGNTTSSIKKNNGNMQRIHIHHQVSKNESTSV